MTDDSPVFPLTSKRRRLPDEGTLEVFVANEQNVEPVEAARWGRLAEQVLDAEGIRGAAELSLLFVEEAAMAELNKRFMDTEGPTDVLAFPLEDDLVGTGRWPDNGTAGPLTNRGEVSDAPMLLGDVVICPAVAARNAPEHAGTYEDEIALLVVHGILHVLGMDHAFPEDEAAMQLKERALLERFHKPV
jgi:probable rRNA maturation factor